MRVRSLITLSMFALAHPAQAQPAYQPVPAFSNHDSIEIPYYLQAGTPVHFKTITQISSRDNKIGDRVYLEIAENILFRGQIVLAAGTPVIGEISGVERNGHFGKKGEVILRLVAIDTPTGRVPISGDSFGYGRNQTALSVGTFVFASMLGGFLIHGTSARIIPGTPVDGHLSVNYRFVWYKDRNAPELGGAMPVMPDSPRQTSMLEVVPQPGFSGIN